MAAAKLTDTQISRAKAKDKPYKLSDGGVYRASTGQSHEDSEPG